MENDSREKCNDDETDSDSERIRLGGRFRYFTTIIAKVIKSESGT